VIADFDLRLRSMADVLVRIGVNLQPGQPLLIAEPYEQQGVARSAEVIVDAVCRSAAELGSAVEVIWSDSAKLRGLAERNEADEFRQLVRHNVRRLERHVAAGGALLFLTGSQPRLFAGLPPERLAAFNAINWRVLGPLVQRLVHGETQWTLAPAPSPTWAALTFADLPAEQRLAALWRVVFAALHAHEPDPVNRWRTQLDSLAAHAARLNARRLRTVCFAGDGCDLTLELPARHHWCTAQLTTRGGVSFVVNLPTEEVFTAPDRHSARGVVRLTRPVVHGGETIEGIELEFRDGRVMRATAQRGGELLQRLLATDDGAARLGEVSLLASDLGDSSRGDWQTARTVFHHPLLDENAAPHIALGEAYPFCHRGWWKRSVNRSLIHVDLPLAARAVLS
jgi:aminopeptidase